MPAQTPPSQTPPDQTQTNQGQPSTGQPSAQNGQPANPIPLVKTSITVTESISAEAPASISVLDTQQLEETPGVNLDDRLRSVPGFSLFRRSSSVVANPTTQGVSLRGIGSTGASRTLVLWDSIPLNDPFGGWVYWDRLPIDELDRVEISRGASTSVFGDLAMGGAIAAFTREASKRFWASYEGGSDNTEEVEAGASDIWRQRFAATTDVRAFSTDGYFIVPANLRGAVDRRANERFVAGNLKLDYLGGVQRFTVKLDILAEERANGTVLQNNSSGLGTLSANYSRDTGSNGVSVLGYDTQENFHSSFSSVALDRNSERLTELQHVPSDAQGGAAFWRHSEKRWDFIVGADVERVHGFSIDAVVNATPRVGGGTLLEHGLFGQFDVTAGAFKFFAGARHQFTGVGGTFLSPNAGFVVGKRWIRARGSVYRAFRSPTLNELYRDFRQGNTETNANPGLLPETVFGAEAGVDLVGESRKASVTLFRNSLNRLITNTTLSSSPTLILRERENGPAALSDGLEANVQQNWRDWRGELRYLYVDSRVLSTGLRLAQIPRHQGSAQLTYAKRRTLASAGIRSYSGQFDDDVNQFYLPGFATVTLSVRQTLTSHVSAIVEVENLLNHQYLTALTPTPTTGEPRFWRIGVRWSTQ